MPYQFPSSATDFYGDFESQQAELERQRQLAIALYKNTIGAANQNAQASGPYNGIAAMLGQIVGGMGMQQSEKDISEKQSALTRRRDEALQSLLQQQPRDTQPSQTYDVPSAAVGLPDFMGGPTQPEQQPGHQVSRQEQLAYALKFAGLGPMGAKIAEMGLTRSLSPEANKPYTFHDVGAPGGGTQTIAFDPTTNRIVGNVGAVKLPEGSLQKTVEEIQKLKPGISLDDAMALALKLKSIIPTPTGSASADVTQMYPGVFNNGGAGGTQTPGNLMPNMQPNATQGTPQNIMPDMQIRGGAPVAQQPTGQNPYRKPEPPNLLNPNDPTNVQGDLAINNAAKVLIDEHLKWQLPTADQALKKAEDMLSKYPPGTDIPGIGGVRWIPGAQLAYFDGMKPDEKKIAEAQYNQQVAQNLLGGVGFAQAGKAFTGTEEAIVKGKLGMTPLNSQENFREGVKLAREAYNNMTNTINASADPAVRALVEKRLSEMQGGNAAAQQDTGKKPMSAMPANLDSRAKADWIMNQWNGIN